MSETHHDLLAHCRTLHRDFDGIVQGEWLSVLRSDDFSGVGLIDISKEKETGKAIAGGDGHAYVVTLDAGEILRVYPIPDQN